VLLLLSHTGNHVTGKERSMFSDSGPDRNLPARRWRGRATIFTFLLLGTTLIGARLAAHTSSGIPQLPSLVLWAWERPEDLRFMRSDDTAVAFLAETIQLQDGEVHSRPRMQPLRVPGNAKLVTVVRIETNHADLNRAQALESAAAIAHTASLPRVVAVQVDFDATLSQRTFYRDLLVELRRQIGPQKPISITALASWCMDDDWLAGLPIDEAVPMLFRMGAGTNEVATRLASGRDFREPLCRGSLGVSTDERWASLPGGRRLYVFNPQPWTEHTEQAVLWETHSWR
jgi:hypothetical protein